MIISQRRKHGFSLIELAVVLTIAGILTLIAIGSYSNFREGRRLRSAAQGINSLFVSARSYAITTGKPHRVVFQLQDPITSSQRFVAWIDEYDPLQPLDSAPVTVMPVTTVRPKITTPEPMTEGVRVADFTVAPEGGTSVTLQYPFTSANYAVIRFMADGTSDYADVHLLEETGDVSLSRDYYTVRLYSATAKPKMYPFERK